MSTTAVEDDKDFPQDIVEATYVRSIVRTLQTECPDDGPSTGTRDAIRYLEGRYRQLVAPYRHRLPPWLDESLSY